MNTNVEFDALPASSYDLIKWLDKNISTSPIEVGETLESAHRRAGNREIVDQLVNIMHEEIEENSLDDDT